MSGDYRKLHFVRVGDRVTLWPSLDGPYCRNCHRKIWLHENWQWSNGEVNHKVCPSRLTPLEKKG